MLRKSKSAKADAPSSTAPKKRPPEERCQGCGHWSTATEYGVDDKSGYCDRWEKLTRADFWCDEYVSREKFKRLQDQLAEENEEFMDEET